MPVPTARRTLVKSPPELWAEVSDVEALARHLGAFGDIRITRAEPESTVAWEGDRARGTVELEPSGWGTRVTLHAHPADPAAPPAPQRRSWVDRLLRRPVPEPAAPPPAPPSVAEAEEVLVTVLDDLGAAHRRPTVG